MVLKVLCMEGLNAPQLANPQAIVDLDSSGVETAKVDHLDLKGLLGFT